MRNRIPLAAVTVIAGLVAACSDPVDMQPPTPGVRAMFDPAAEVVPLPSDVLKDPNTGLMALPASDADSELTRQIKESINTLDGWLVTSTVTIPFDGPLDPSTVNAKNVLLYDVTHARDAGGAKVERMPADSYYVLYNVGPKPATQAPYWVTVKNKSAKVGEYPKRFVEGHKYAVVITDALRGADGLPVIQNAAFHLLASQTPLVDEQGHSTTILPDADMKQLEGARRSIFGPAAAAIETDSGVSRRRFVSMTAFSIESGPRPAFDPTMNDLPSPWGKDADVTDVPEVQFNLPYAPKSVVPGSSCYFWRVDQSGLVPVSFHVEPADQPNDKGRYPLKFLANEKIRPNTTYQIAVTDGVMGLNETAAQSEAFFSLVSATEPLVSDGKLNSPFIDFSLDVLIFLGSDPQTATAEDWDLANGLLTSSLEGLDKLRASYQEQFERAEKAAGLERKNIRVMWTFTTKEAQQ